MPSLSDCIKLCQLIKYKAGQVCRFTRECNSIAAAARGIEQALVTASKSAQTRAPDVQEACKLLFRALEEAAGVISDCCSCGLIRGLLIAGSLRRRIAATSEHLAEVQRASLVADVPGWTPAEVQTETDTDAMQHAAAGTFVQLVLQAQQHTKARDKVLQEVVALLQQHSQTVGHTTVQATAQEAAFGGLPVALLEAEVADLRLPRIGGDVQVLRMQQTVADVIDERLFQLDVAPKGLRCPLSQQLFTEPIILVESAQTYEFSALEQWLAQGNMIDPVTGMELTSAAVIPNVQAKQMAEDWAAHHAQKKQRHEEQLHKQQRQKQWRRQQLRKFFVKLLQADILFKLQHLAHLPDSVLAAELAAQCGYQFIKQLSDQSMFGASRALQVRSNHTNRLHTLLQIPRVQLQRLDHSQRQELARGLQQASELHHPHTLQVQEVFLGPLHLNIVLEECSAGRLVDFPAQQHSMWAAGDDGGSVVGSSGAALSPEFARWFFQQVVLAVDYCHTKGVAGLAIEDTLLKVAPKLPQPAVKVTTPLLAGGLPAVCSQTTTDSTGDPIVSSDLYSCGVLLLRLLGVDLRQEQGDRWQQQLQQRLQAQQLQQRQQQTPQEQHQAQEQQAAMIQLLQGLLHPDSAQRRSMADIMANTWFRQHLPPTASNMTQRFVAKGRTCRQPAEDIAAIADLACSSRPPQQHLQALTQQRQLETVSHEQQQQQQLLNHHTCFAASAVNSALQQSMLGLQLHALLQATAQLAALCSSPGFTRLPAAGVVVVVVYSIQYLCGRLTALQRAWRCRQSQDMAPMLLALQSSSDVVLRASLLLNLLQAVQQLFQQQQQYTTASQLLLVTSLHSQLLSDTWQALRAVVVAAAAANAACNVSNSINATLQSQQLSLPALPTSPRAVARQGALRDAQQLLVGVVLQPLIATPGGPLCGSDALGVVMLPPTRPLFAYHKALGAATLCQALAAAAATNAAAKMQPQLCRSLRVFASATATFEALSCGRHQLQLVDCAHGCVVLDATCDTQAMQVVGLTALWHDGSCRQQHDSDKGAAAADHPSLALMSAAHTPEASSQLAHTLQQLLAADGSSHALAPIHGMCLDPPVLVLPKPPCGTLEQWIRTAGSRFAGGVGDFTAAWVSGMSWTQVLQLLGDVAAALGLLHQQQPAVVHGGVHAAAINLLQQLSHQQQQQSVSGSGCVCQLSLAGLLSQLAPISSCHPFLAAPEVALAAGPATPAADVYGFGVLMFQLASGWLPQQYTPGTNEQISAVMWCREMMATAGTTSPLAAAACLQQQQSSGSVCEPAGPWTPYGRHMLSPDAQARLPAGYYGLMEACLQRTAAARPNMFLVAARLQDMAQEPHA